MASTPVELTWADVAASGNLVPMVMRVITGLGDAAENEFVFTRVAPLTILSIVLANSSKVDFTVQLR